jgi:hypothetical protein
MDMKAPGTPCPVLHSIPLAKNGRAENEPC